MNSFLLRKLFRGLGLVFFFCAQISPKQLEFVASDLACAGYNPEGGMHFLYRLKKFHFTITN